MIMVIKDVRKRRDTKFFRLRLFYVFSTSIIRLDYVVITPLIRLNRLKNERGGCLMNERSEFIKKGEEILSFVDDYNILRHEYLNMFFPGSGKIVNYLLKTGRLYRSLDGFYISTDKKTTPDKCLIAALGVLADLSGKVKTHARAAAPAQIAFTTHSGDFYEIIYVGFGMELMMAASFEMQAAIERPNDYVGTIKRIIIVEDKSQMESLQIPGITRFALVSPDGSLSYFKGS